MRRKIFCGVGVAESPDDDRLDATNGDTHDGTHGDRDTQMETHTERHTRRDTREKSRLMTRLIGDSEVERDVAKESSIGIDCKCLVKNTLPREFLVKNTLP